MFKVVQKVWCLIYGQGVVTEVDDDYIDEDRIEDTYSVFVKFQNHDDSLSISYTTDGSISSRVTSPSSLTLSKSSNQSPNPQSTGAMSPLNTTTLLRIQMVRVT